MENNLTIAAIQMISSTVAEYNLNKASELVKLAALSGAKLIVLPEFFICIAGNNKNYLGNIAETLGNGKLQEQLATIALENKIYLVAGTIPIKSPITNKCYNTMLVYDPTGRLICYYHKIHLFKFDNGIHHFNEADTFTHGNERKTFNIDNFSFGLSICYDIRFPELFRLATPVDAFILVAAFLQHTGKDHWEVLLRARAIENQCYMIASAQGGTHDSGRHTYGHSMCIDPWGKIQDMLAYGEGIVISHLSKAKIAQVREELPALNNKRL